MIRLVLLRHGETAWNGERRLQGQQDLSLSDHGRAQVEAIAPLVRIHKPDHVICSPLLRARETAKLMGYDDAEPDARWMEASLGDWEGLYSADLLAMPDGRYSAWRTGRFTPPGGEPFNQLQQRTVEAVDDAVTKAVAHNWSTVLVVTHGGPIRAVCAALTGLDPQRAVPAAPASLSALDFTPERQPRLRLYNLSAEVSHIEPPD